MRSHLIWNRRLLGLLALVVAASSALGFQEELAPSVEEVQARIQAAEASTADNRESVAELYRNSLAALKRANEWRAKAQDFAADTAEAPALLDSLRIELAAPPSEAEFTAGADKTLPEMVSRLEQANAELAAARAQVDELAKLAEHRTQRKSQFPEQSTATEQALSGLQEAIAAIPRAPENEARRTLLLAQIEEQRAIAASIAAERESYEARRELLPLRRDRALRRISQSERAVAFWTKQTEAKREREGNAAAREAERTLEEIALSYPQLEELANNTRELAARRSGEEGLPKRISRARSRLVETKALREEVDNRFRGARRRIAASGLTESMGLILRRDYEWLPKLPALKTKAEEREKQLSKAQLDLIALEEERAAVGDLALATERLLASLKLETPREDLARTAGELLAKQRESQDAVLSELSKLTSTLFELKDVAKELAESTTLYREFIETRILWVRSTSLKPTESLRAVPGHVSDIVRTLSESNLLDDLEASARKHSGACTGVGIWFLLLVAGRGFVRRKREEMGVLVRSYRTDKYLYTLRALAQTIVLALPLPLLAYTLGWLLTFSPTELVRAIGEGMDETALAWFVLRFVWWLSSEKGMGGAHFKWPGPSLVALRKELRWFEPVGLILGFVALALDGQSVTDWSDSVGRLAFVLVMIALGIFSHRLLREQSGFWAASPQTGKGIVARTHFIWSLVAWSVPVVLAGLASFGYYYTALQFELRVRYSMRFALILILVNALLLRWLFVTRRRLAVTQALEAKARREQEEKTEGVSESGSTALDADKVNIPAVDAQTRQLFKTSITLAAVLGLFSIWSGVLPALRGLDKVQLLPTLAIVSPEDELPPAQLTTPVQSNGANPSNQATQVPGAPGFPTGTVSESTNAGEGGVGIPTTVTLADALLALVFLLLTTVAAKNLPALLELALLQRLPLDSGSRYAISTITRYVILIIGLSAVSGAMGIGWQQVQWLAAALTFGLAFGLQEIFANFVSGIIILIERPVRVGDIVTVGTTEGRVTQLRMRATTILDWDRREYLVPNKEFITGSVINWTLSDPVTRVILPVGIAYGSDTKLARKLLLECAKKSTLVLTDPAPSAIFRSFGDSSLNFELRVFVANRDFWPQVIDKLHSLIDDAFRKADIEIAFPQRDIHVRSIEGLHEKPSVGDAPEHESK